MTELKQQDSTSLFEYCARCPESTHCCSRAGNIVVLPHERDAIAVRTGRSDIFDDRETVSLIRKPEGRACPLLTPDRRCSIYDIRPMDCRTWPLTASNDGSHLVYDVECPAAGAAMDQPSFVEAVRQMVASIPPSCVDEARELILEDDTVTLVPMEIPALGNTVGFLSPDGAGNGERQPTLRSDRVDR